MVLSCIHMNPFIFDMFYSFESSKINQHLQRHYNLKLWSKTLKSLRILNLVLLFMYLSSKSICWNLKLLPRSEEKQFTIKIFSVLTNLGSYSRTTDVTTLEFLNFCLSNVNEKIVKCRIWQKMGASGAILGMSAPIVSVGCSQLLTPILLSSFRKEWSVFPSHHRNPDWNSYCLWNGGWPF